MAVIYRVRDGQGNIYGPADSETMRQWIREGRIIKGMMVTAEGEGEWREIFSDPVFADLFGGSPAGAVQSGVPSGVPSGMGPGAGMPGTFGNEYQVSRVGGGGVGGGVGGMGMGMGAQLNMLGMVSMIAGILSIVLCCCYGVPSLILGPTAIVMALIGMRQIKNNEGKYYGRGMALAGLFCGIAGIIVGLGYLGFMIAILASSNHR